MPAGKNADGSVGFRMDECAQRLFLREGTAEDVCAIGLCADGSDEYATTLARLTANNIDFETQNETAAAARGVKHLVQLSGPYGMPIEVATPLQRADAPFTPRYPNEEWLLGDLGVGHILLLVPDKAVVSQFLIDCFGFRYSNTGKGSWNGMEGAEVDFLNCNARHHSLAPATVGQRLPQLVGHFMLERKTVDGVGLTYDRVRKAGLHVTNEIGRHTDGALSFYAQTPSGFDFEIGTEGFQIDDDWEVFELTSYSNWGHAFHPASPPA